MADKLPKNAWTWPSLPSPGSPRALRRAATRRLERFERLAQGYRADDDPYGSAKSRLARAAGVSTATTFTVSGRFDFAEDPNETRRGLHSIYKKVRALDRSNRPAAVFLDIADLEHVDLPSLLYLDAFTHWAVQLPRVRVGGNYAKALPVRQLMTDIGYWELIGVQPPEQANPARKVAGLRHGHQLKGWHDLHQFLVDSMGKQLEVEERDRLYDAFNECTENVRRHADHADLGDRRPRCWYAAGWVREIDRTCMVSILDLGVGIPATLQTKWVGERFFRDDASWLALATSGERPRTGEAKHGYGLKRLREFSEGAEGRAMTIISGRAAVRFGDTAATVEDRTRNLVGTVVQIAVEGADG